MYFSAPARSQVQRTWNLIYLKTGLFFKYLRCDFWISQPKKLTHTKFQDERITRTIVITEKINLEWWILHQNIHFDQIFKSQ